MEAVLNSYNAKVDAKKRITLRNARFEYYNIQEKANGQIVLSPRTLVDPFSISAKSLKMMDSSMKNFKKGKVGKPINIYEF